MNPILLDAYRFVVIQVASAALLCLLVSAVMNALYLFATSPRGAA